MSEQHDQKHDEKEEQGHGEKGPNDALSTVIWAVILIWAGLVFLAESLGWLARLEPLTAWGLVFIGAGVIVLLEALARWLLPEYRRPIGGTIIFGVILIAVGLGNRVSWTVAGPIALIVIGAAILLRGFLRKK